jgi:GntR family transcriptional regulator
MITFQRDPNSGVPIYRQIKDQVRYGIAAGLLRPGEQLPTVRALAVELSVNPNTVIKAYSELEQEGIVASEQGSGTFVSQNAPVAPSAEEREAKLESLCAEFLGQAARYGFAAGDVVRGIQALTRRTQR